MKITVLIENSAQSGLCAEHGLSLYIEHRGVRWLLDAGETDAFARNARVLGVDLSAVDFAVLSHSHSDHAGGLPAFFEKNGGAPLWLRAEAAGFCCGADGAYIGPPRELFGVWSGRLLPVQTAGPLEISDGVWLLPHSRPGLAARGSRCGLYRQCGGALLPDDFSHEQSLLFLTRAGLVVCCSCCHSGADVVIEEVMAAFPGVPVRALIGGFHLMDLEHPSALGVPREEVSALGKRLQELGIRTVVTGHCTGCAAYSILREQLGDILRPLRAGAVLELSE